jgi:hypothetical protein
LIASVAVISRAAAWLSPTHPVAAAKPPAGQPNTNRPPEPQPLNHNRRNYAISHTICGAMTANHGPSKAGEPDYRTHGIKGAQLCAMIDRRK